VPLGFLRVRAVAIEGAHRLCPGFTVAAGVAGTVTGTYNQRSMRRLLIENGWSEVRGGKHAVKMTKTGERPITLPMHQRRDYGRLAASILRQAGLQ
jgi:predicted RNA binding protein YcfA (HicA-like mRNA interferase family)